MVTETFIHVGYGKTATSWLQEKIFSKLSKEIFLGKRKNDFPRWLLKINYLDPLAYISQRDDIKNKLSKYYENKKKIIISSEAFTNLGSIHNQAYRIKDLFENPKIIIVLREPINWLISNYKYCVEYENFYLNFEDYLDFGKYRTPFALEKRPPFYIPDLFYDEVVLFYNNLFGEKNILVLKYEDFIINPENFQNLLEEFTEIALPNFRENSKIKVLKSKSDSIISDMRLSNLKKMVDFTTGKISNSKYDLINKIPKRPLIKNETKEELIEIYKSKCSKFYPEL